MPRSEQSQAGKIVEFFRSASLENAELVLGLVKDAVRARQQKSKDAKARATLGSTPGAVVAHEKAKPKKKAAKRTARKPRARKPQDVSLPLDTLSQPQYEDAPPTV